MSIEAAVSDSLSPLELQRYSRHILMPEVGLEGQLKLKRAKVLLIGAGGLGAPLGLYLAAAGVGTLGLVDFDVVDSSNLQRQVTFSGGDVGRSKVQAARERLAGINDQIELRLHETRLTSGNALDILRDYDIVVDGTDNFPTRYLVNDACVLLGKPNVYGSIFRFEGQLSVFWAGHGPCYRCLYPEPPPPGMVPSCAEGGVLGVLPGIVGSLQAMETIKLILGAGTPMIGRLLLFDGLGMSFRELKLKKDASCPVCGDNPAIRELIDYDQFCAPDSAAGSAPADDDLGPLDVKAMMDARRRFVLLDVREEVEWEICHIEGARLIPLGELEARLGELDPSGQIVVHCKSGVRSRKAVQMMREAGFSDVFNMAGGILAWSEQVDPTVPKY